MTRQVRCLSLFLFLFALPLFGGFGPERPVTSSDVGLLQDYRARPRIASSGDGYLVAYFDHRGGAYGIWGARVAADGTLLDPTGFLIARANDVHLVWSGETYVAFWHQADIGALWAVTISPDGVVGTPKVAMQMPRLMGITDFAVATNGSTILVATTLGTAALLEADGTHIGTLDIAGGAYLLNIDIAAASVGGEYLLAFGMNTGVVTQRVSASGQVSAPVPQEGTPRSATIDIGTDGTNYFVVAAAHDLTGLVLTRENNRAGELRVLAPAQTISGLPLVTANPRVAWRGGEYLVTYRQKAQYELYSLRVSQNGTPIAAPVLFDHGSNYGEAELETRSGSSGAAVWVDRDLHVQVGLFDAGTFANAKPIDYTASHQTEPALARVGNRFVAGWREYGPNGHELRIGAFGGEPRVVAKLSGMYWWPAEVLFDGKTVWVVWLDDVHYYRRYTPALEPIDAAPVSFDLGRDLREINFTATAGRDGILVVAEGTFGLLAVALHDEGGNVVKTIALIHAASFHFHHPDAVWDGQRYVIAYAHDLDTTWWQMPQPIPNEVLLTRVSREGALLDAEPVLITSDNPKDISAVRVAHGSDGAIAIAWQGVEGWVSMARFTGEPKPPATVLPMHWLKLGEVVALPGGYAVFRHTSAEVQYEKLANDLTRVAGPEPVPASPSYRVETLGGKLYVLYSRITPDEKQYGGVPRLFWRTDDDALRRRRSVR